MALTKVFQKYFSNIFIAIVQQDNEWIIYSKVIKNGVLKEKFSKNFEAKENDTIPIKMQMYLDTLQTEYNFAYIALFLDSMGQGAINGTTATDFEKNSVDMKSVTHFDINKKWSVYASFIDINWVKKLFVNVGLDFIYSPFMVQHALIKKEKLKQKPTLYILNHQDSVTITVFADGNLLFGAYFKTTTDDNLTSGDEEDWENVEEEEGIENIAELDSLNEDEMTSIDDLDELSDLDGNDEGGMFEDIDNENKDLGHFDGEAISKDSSLELT
jgi:hypothetical protein